MYARELVKDGYLGEILAVHLTVLAAAQLERGSGRIWQGQRKAGANTLTMAGGHGIEAMCTIFGELAEVSPRLATRLRTGGHSGHGEKARLVAPVVYNVAAR